MPTGISGLRRRGVGRQLGWLLSLVFFATQGVLVAADYCAVCEKGIRFSIIFWTDEVTHAKNTLCPDCSKLPNNCFLCSMPVLKNFTTLPDGRVICKRDVSTVILDDQQATQICDQVKKDLDRQFLRFITFPETNVTVGLMDRVKLQELYKIVGKDFSCPDTRGCTETKTNAGQQEFEISILSGQPREDVMTTCVHEYAHTWIIENVPSDRLKKIGKDAVEGFCELLSYLFAEQHGLVTGRSNILANHYTRGQIHLFIEAHRQHGFEDIIDWMKAGDDPLLRRDDLSRLRRLEDRSKPISATTNLNATAPITPMTNSPAKLPEHLVLQGIVWSKTQPMATISGRNFDLNHEATIPLQNGLVIVQCLEIHPTSVVLQTNNAPERLVLKLK